APPQAPSRRPDHDPGRAVRDHPPLRQPELRLSSRSGSPPRSSPLYHLDREGAQPLAVRARRPRPAGPPCSCRLGRVLGKRRPPGGWQPPGVSAAVPKRKIQTPEAPWFDYGIASETWGRYSSPAKRNLCVFEPTAEIIRKGKANKPTEFGKLVKIQEAENQIITHYA